MVGRRLRWGNKGKERGKRWRSSPRLQWASKRARRRAGDGEFDGDDSRSPKRGTATWRRCRASGDSWSGGEEEGVEAELLSWSGERGVVGDGG